MVYIIPQTFTVTSEHIRFSGADLRGGGDYDVQCRATPTIRELAPVTAEEVERMIGSSPNKSFQLDPAPPWLTIRYDTRCYFNVRSKADISQLNLPHGTDN